MEIVHPVPADEIAGWLASMRTTYLGSSSGADLDARLARARAFWAPDRVWGVRDHGRWVATLEAVPAKITVPGGEIAISTITRVSVAATHRRRGLLTRMITEANAVAHTSGAVASALIPSEWPIYGRFGYAPATRTAHYTLRTDRPGGAVAADPAGSVRAVDADQAFDIAPAILQRVRAARAGQLDRSPERWQRRYGGGGFEPLAGTPSNWIIHDGEDGPDGMLLWQPLRDSDDRGKPGAIEVRDLLAGSDCAYRNLWAYLAGIDLVGEVLFDRRPVDEPVRWLLPDGRALRTDHVGDDTWLRLFDVRAALAARSYTGSGRIVLDVVDEHGGFAAGRYLLDTDGATATCARTDAAADLRVGQRALASVYLGDRSLRSMLLTGEIDELSPGALARADALFATPLPPWNATSF